MDKRPTLQHCIAFCPSSRRQRRNFDSSLVRPAVSQSREMSFESSTNRSLLSCFQWVSLEDLFFARSLSFARINSIETKWNIRHLSCWQPFLCLELDDEWDRFFFFCWSNSRSPRNTWPIRPNICSISCTWDSLRIRLVASQLRFRRWKGDRHSCLAVSKCWSNKTVWTILQRNPERFDKTFSDRGDGSVFIFDWREKARPSKVFAFVQGDLTHNRDPYFASSQYEIEWKTYRDVLDRTEITKSTKWLDIRGNHGSLLFALSLNEFLLSTLIKDSFMDPDPDSNKSFYRFQDESFTER